jgi:hypothetical protein
VALLTDTSFHLNATLRGYDKKTIFVGAGSLYQLVDVVRGAKCDAIRERDGGE